MSAVFVGGIPFTTTQEDVTKFFEGCAQQQAWPVTSRRLGQWPCPHATAADTAADTNAVGCRKGAGRSSRSASRRRTARVRSGPTNPPPHSAPSSPSSLLRSLPPTSRGCRCCWWWWWWRFLVRLMSLAVLMLMLLSAGWAKGFCHVTFETQEQAQAACAKDGEFMGSRYLKITIANAHNSNGGSRTSAGQPASQPAVLLARQPPPVSSHCSSCSSCFFCSCCPMSSAALLLSALPAALPAPILHALSRSISSPFARSLSPYLLTRPARTVISILGRCQLV